MSSRRALSSSASLEDSTQVEILEGKGHSMISSRESAVRVEVGVDVVKIILTWEESIWSVETGSWLSSIDFNLFFLSVPAVRVFLFCGREAFNFVMSFAEDFISIIV